MDEEQFSTDTFAVIECVCSVAAAVVFLAIAAATLVSAFRMLIERDAAARTLCRRWAYVASAAVAAWYLSSSHIVVDPLIPIVAAIAAVDGWLAILSCPQPAIPRARARRRMHPS